MKTLVSFDYLLSSLHVSVGEYVDIVRRNKILIILVNIPFLTIFYILASYANDNLSILSGEITSIVANGRSK